LATITCAKELFLRLVKKNKTVGLCMPYKHVGLALRLVCLLSFWGLSATEQNICNVLDFGANGDNATEDTAAAVAAIKTCEPGGVVIFPSGGIYLLRPIELPSHIEIRVEGTIAAWRDIKSWPNSTFRKCNTG
jgi:hypothetical protein